MARYVEFVRHDGGKVTINAELVQFWWENAHVEGETIIFVDNPKVPAFAVKGSPHEVGLIIAGRK